MKRTSTTTLSAAGIMSNKMGKSSSGEETEHDNSSQEKSTSRQFGSGFHVLFLYLIHHHYLGEVELALVDVRLRQHHVRSFKCIRLIDNAKQEKRDKG
jgi:hypothetical protein